MIYALERSEAEMDAELNRLPLCDKCEERIQQESALRIDGRWFCESCVEDMMQRIEVD